MLLDALDVFEDEPEMRHRREHCSEKFWSFEESCEKQFWGFSLLGLIAAEQGLDLVEIPRNQQIVPVREFLSKIGFTYYDQLCLEEINGHSLNNEVLRERTLRFTATGDRMPFLDDLLDIDKET